MSVMTQQATEAAAAAVPVELPKLYVDHREKQGMETLVKAVVAWRNAGKPHKR